MSRTIRADGPCKRAAHVLHVVALARSFRLVTVDPLVDTNILVATERGFGLVVQGHAGRGPVG